MAYLTFTGSEEKNSCFKFIGANTQEHSTNLISATTSLISNNTSLIFNSNESGLDACSFYSGPSDATIFAFGESQETCGSIAYTGSESCGSIAFSGSGETCGSIASATSSSSSVCSYSC